MSRLIHPFLAAFALVCSPATGDPPKADASALSDADRLWDTLSAEKQRLLIKQAPKYVKASDGRIYLVQVEEEQNVISRKPEAGRTERERAVMDDGAPVLYEPGEKKMFANRDAQYTAHCDKVRAAWEARCSDIKRAELAKVAGDYVVAIEVVQVLPDGLLVRMEKEGGTSDDRIVRLDKYPLNRVVVDGDRLRADMKVRNIGRYQYTSTIGATRTIERYEVSKVFDWDTVLPKLELPKRSFTPVKAAELAYVATMENWPGLPEWRIKKVKTSDGRDGGDVVGQTDNGWSTTRFVARHDSAVLQTYEWRWELRYLPLSDYQR